MSATIEQKSIVISMLKSKSNSVAAVNTALGGIAGLDPATSTSKDIQAQVDAYNAVRGNRSQYGNISLPSLDASGALSAVSTEAADTPDETPEVM